MKEGLSTAEAGKRLKQYGYNELPAEKNRNLWQIAIEVVKEPMFILLLAGGLLYILLGNYQEGIILFSSILIIIFITFYQSQKTEHALSALKKLSSPKVLLIRDGVQARVPGREVVPGDIMILNEGDRVAADAIVLDSLNLKMDESLLTGESMAVNKEAKLGEAAHHNKIFNGTLVIQGRGLAEVISTGTATEMGKIGVSLQTIAQEETRLQKEMKVLVRNLFIIGALISVGIVFAFYFTRGHFIQSLLNGIAASIAILPEEFPVVLTVFLALGSWRLSKKNVLTRKDAAIEALGATTVLCADKTGTITQNKMEIAAIYNGSELFYKNTFSEKQGHLSELMTAASRASAKDSVDPMEKAIDQAYKTVFLYGDDDYRLIKEYPLSRELLAMTRVTESEENVVSVSAKGAPEAIFKLCDIHGSELEAYMSVVRQMGDEGYRVIAVANAPTGGSELPEKQHHFKFSFLGLIALEDPIRPEVPAAVKECKEAGIRLIMITGDFPATARSIAMQIGLDPSGKLVTGTELENMSEEELRKEIPGINIFARVVPDQKLRIVQALKANNEIVAMTGDGVNDAPALKAAHIGVAMGNKGTDVAREAASMVLLDDNFASIVAAIRSGRRIFDNLQKAMTYIMAIHIPIIGLTLLPAFFSGLPLLLMPLHIVFMELIIDPICSVAFESEQEEKNIMNRPPRATDHKFFGTGRILNSVFEGAMLLATVLVVYFLSLQEQHTEGEVRAIAFSSLVIGNVFLILTNLSKTRSFASIITGKNWAAILMLSIALLMLFIMISVPAMQRVFSLEFRGYKHFLPSIIAAGIMLAVLEAIKYARFRRHTAWLSKR